MGEAKEDRIRSALFGSNRHAGGHPDHVRSPAFRRKNNKGNAAKRRELKIPALLSRGGSLKTCSDCGSRMQDNDMLGLCYKCSTIGVDKLQPLKIPDEPVSPKLIRTSRGVLFTKR